jgi:predicted Ser/Thr protein kinase
MSAINFEGIFKELESKVESIAKDSLKDYEQQAKADGQTALNNAKENLQQWIKELETGSITREDLGDLLQEEEALTKMIALKQAGLAEVRVDKFRNDVINMIVSTVTGLVKV